MESKRARRPFTWTLKPVLGENVTTTCIDTVNVFVDTIIDRKYTSTIIKTLAELSAVTSLTHLKRVKNQTIILMLANNLNPDECVMELKKRGFDFTGLSGQPEIIPVPKTMPKTIAQNHKARDLWPCNFHPDKRLESILAGEFFDELELATINGHMSTALECASTTGVGAVVVDPQSNLIVAQSGDFRYSSNSNTLFGSYIIVIQKTILVFKYFIQINIYLATFILCLFYSHVYRHISHWCW